MASIDKNQYDFLYNLMNGKNSDGTDASEGNMSWAKSQLAENTYTPEPQQSAPNPTPTYNPYNAASPGNVPTPSTGYGGANYGNADSATRQGIESNESRLANDKGFVQSEIARAQGVINERSGAGMDVSEQNAYLNRLMGMQPKPTPQPAPVHPTPVATAANQAYTPPVNMSDYKALTPAQIQAEAQARIAKMVAEKTRIANQTKQGFQSSYDKLQGNIKEDRALQDVRDQRALNPFSGRSDYAQGMKTLQRERADRENQQDLQTRLGNVDMSLSDFLNQTPEQQQEIINQLTRQERDYGLQVDNQAFNQYDRNRNFGLQEGQLMGNYNGQRTLAGQQLDHNMSTDKRDYDYQVGRDKVQDNQWTQQYGMQRDQLMAQLTGRLPNGQTTTAEQQRQLSNLWIVAEQTGKIPDELADLYNIPRGTQTAQAKQQAITNGISQQNANTSQKNAETSAKNSTTNASKTTVPSTKEAQTKLDNDSYAEFTSELPEMENYEEAKAYIDSYVDANGNPTISSSLRSKMLKEAQSKFL